MKTNDDILYHIGNKLLASLVCNNKRVAELELKTPEDR